MGKKVLAIYYSQSGQLGEIVNSVLSPIRAEDISVEILRVQPVTDFPFPWTSEQFFDAMPESVLAQPVPLQPFQLKENKYDLVIFAYQPWYLSLSIPSLSAILHPQIQAVIKDTRVVTLIGSRNMWLSSQEKLKKLLKESGARLVGNIALADRNGNLISAVTILYWMLTGKKDKWLGIFPNPGVSDADISNASRFGDIILEHLKTGNWTDLQPRLVSAGAAEVKTLLLFIEERAPRLFSIWANLIIKSKSRKALLVAFKYYLLLALFIVAPIILTFYSVLFLPFLGKRVGEKKKYYQGL